MRRSGRSMPGRARRRLPGGSWTGVAAGVLRSLTCAPAIRCCGSDKSSGGRRTRAAVERGAAGRARDRGRDRRCRGKEAGAAGRAGAGAADAARRRPRTRLVASGRHVGDTEADHAALSEIVVRVEAEHIEMVLHWQGGDHTALKLKKNGVGKHRWTIPEDTLSLVRELARLMPDRQIARLLNRAGKPTGRGNGWTQARVRSFRSHHGIAVDAALAPLRRSE